MNLYPQFILPLIFLCFFITIHAQNLINTSCTTFANNDPNINYNFCVTSLQAAPGSQCATLYELGKISIGLIKNNVTDTRYQIKQFLKSRKLDAYVKQCLNDCLELYTDAIDSVTQGMKYYEAKRFNDANFQISSIIDVATTCEDGFTERDGVVSPLTKRNNNTFQLSALALSVMHLIQTGSS